jgi:hypothetical protein
MIFGFVGGFAKKLPRFERIDAIKVVVFINPGQIVVRSIGALDLNP